MSKLSATPDIVVVDPDIGQSSAPTTIAYEKFRDEELWTRRSGGAWTQENVHLLTGLGDAADADGSYAVSLRPGDVYEVGVFQFRHGPTSTDPIRSASLTVFALLKKPHEAPLITDQNFDFGGTWCFHQVVTRIPTNIVAMAVSRRPPVIDSDGIPHAVDPDGTLSPERALTSNHRHQILDLFPGNQYFSSVVVADAKGNWEIRERTFTTLRRVVLIEFPRITVLNDGDPFAHGEGEFWFRVHTGANNMPTVLQDFHQATTDIDDWSEQGRPYAMGFAYVGKPEAVTAEAYEVSVASWAIEHDGFLEADEGAASKGDGRLRFPSGFQVENAKGALILDCPFSTTGDDFHYNVDVTWSVSYVT